MYRALLNEKIGNILRYFAEKLGYLPSMKAYKLLFFLDQLAIAEKGVPVTWLEYRAWKFGPVPNSLWEELRHGVMPYGANGERFSLKPYLHVHQFENELSGNVEINLIANGAFEDGEFSSYELELLDRIVQMYGGMSGYQLSQLSHAEGSAWTRAVQQHGLERRFELGDLTPDVMIDLAADIVDPAKFEAYLAAKTALETQTHIRHFATQYGTSSSPEQVS